MSINKAQGQTFDVVGLHLKSPCFSHGQFYVGCSRVRSAKNVFILPQEKRLTGNIVYIQRSFELKNVHMLFN
jgi:ATP-dependent exoDNAse (exonuclease V) alpha subunit